MRKILNSNPFRLIISAIFLVFIAASCSMSSDEDDRIYDIAKYLIYKQSLKQNQNAAINVLAKLGNKVEIASTGKDTNNKSVVFFYFTQLVDHNDPSKGTFQQYCVLHYKGKDNITVLQTNGYSIREKENYMIDDMANIFDTNYLEVEHRYNKRSGLDLEYNIKSPEYWQYNTTEQATADLHEIVTAFKETSDFNGKWISTGTSKNGILTAMYAYKYPNEIDVYVPYCAPFLNELKSLSVGTYLVEESGKNDVIDESTGTTVRDLMWKSLTDYLENPDAKKAVFNLIKEKNPGVEVNENALRLFIIDYFMSTAFSKFSYFNVDLWKDVIPLYDNYEQDEEGQSLYAQSFYIFATMEYSNFASNIQYLREINGLSVDSRSLNSYMHIEPPAEVVDIAYFIQATKELGYYLLDWNFLKEKGLMTDAEIDYFNNSLNIVNLTEDYHIEYDNGALMNGFFNFLAGNSSNDKCRMVFVYGENDPWTGGAIADNLADDTYVKKIIIKKGVHSSSLNNELYYSKEDREKIVSAIENFLQ